MHNHDSSEPVVEQWMRDAVVNMRQDELRWLRAASVEHDARIIARHYAARQPDSGEPNRRKSKYGVLVDGEPLENLEQAIPAEPPASPAGDAVATDNLRPNQYEIEPKPPVGDEQALSCGEAWIRYSQDVLMYRFGGKAESANDWDRLQHSFDAGWNAATAQLRQELGQLQESKRQAIQVLDRWQGVIDFLQQSFDVKEWGGTWQDAVLGRLTKLRVAEAALAQAGEQALRDAADAWENGGMDENSYTGFLRERADALAARQTTCREAPTSPTTTKEE